MTIDEAIKHCEEVAEKNETKGKMIQNNFSKLRREQKQEIDSCFECASEHRQLAEWLRELKKYRAIFEKVGKILADNGYTIDDLDTIFGKVNGEVNADETSNNDR